MSNNISKSNLEKELAKLLQKFREEKGLSQESLGVQIGKGQSDIAKIESGNKRITVVELLYWMKALDISYERLSVVIERLYLNINDKKSFWNKE